MGGPSSNFNVDYSTKWNSFQGDTQTSVYGPSSTRGPTFTDAISSMSAFQFIESYTQDISNPTLPPPSSATNTSSSNSTNASQSQTQYISDETKYGAAYATAFSSLLQQEVTSGALTNQQASELIYAMMSGQTIPDNPTLNAMLQTLNGQVMQSLSASYGNTFPGVTEQANTVATNGETAVNAAAQQLSQLQNYANSLPPGQDKTNLQNFINQAQDNLGSIQQTLSQIGNTADPGQLSQLLAALSTQIGTLNQQLGSAGSISSDPNVNAALGNIVKNLQNSMGTLSNQVQDSVLINQLSQGNWSQITSNESQTFMQALQTTYARAFNNALAAYAKQNNLSSAQTAQIEFAHNNPSVPVSADVQQMLSAVNASATSSLSNLWGVPPGATPPVDNTKFNAAVSTSYDNQFTSLLQNTDLSSIAKQLGVSTNDVQGMLEYLHNNPGLVQQLSQNPSLAQQYLGISNGSQFQLLSAQLTTIQNQAASGISQKYGLPSGYTPDPSSTVYNGQLNGMFMQQFRSLLNNQQPPLSQTQIAQVKAALSNPLDPAISPETKSLVQNLYSQAVGAIQKQYNLPVGWSPSIQYLGQAANPPKHLQTAQSGINYVKEALNLVGNFTDSSPDGASEALLINVIKLVASALSKLEEQIAQIETVDSQLEANITNVQAQAQQQVITDQMNKMKEAEQKMQKMKPLMKFMNIFGPVMKAIMAVVMLAFVPVGELLAASMFQDIANQAQGGKQGQDFLTNMFQDIMTQIPRPANIVAAALVMNTMCAACPGAPLLEMQMFFNNSGIVQQTVEMFGGSQSQADMANSIAEQAAQLIATIALVIASGGAASELLGVEITEDLAEGLEEASQMVENITTALQNASEETMTLNETTDDVAQVGDETTQILEEGTSQTRNFEINIEEEGEIQDEDEEEFADEIGGEQGGIEGEGEINGEGESAEEEEGVEPQKLTPDELQNLSKEDLEEQLDAWQNKLDDLTQQVDAKKLTTTLQRIKTLMGIVSALQNAATSGINGANSIIQGQLALFNAQMDAQIEELQGLIDVYEKLLSKITEALKGLSSWYSDTGQQQQNMWSGLSQTVTTIANAGSA